SVSPWVVQIAEHFIRRTFVVPAFETRLAAPAADAGLQHDPRSARHIRRRCRDDLAGDVAAGDVRQWNRHTREPAPLPQVEMVQRAGPHANSASPGPGSGSGTSS